VDEGTQPGAQGRDDGEQDAQDPECGEEGREGLGHPAGEQATGPADRRPGALGGTGVRGGTHVSTVGTPSPPRPSSGRGRRAGLDTGALPGGSDNLAHVTESQARRFERGTDGPKVIVVGVDGSESSMRAAAYALGLARRQGATLAAVYVRPVMAAGVALGAPAADATDEI